MDDTIKEVNRESSTMSSYPTFSVSDFWGEQKDEVIEMIREGRVVIMGAYVALNDANPTYYSPSDIDLGMTIIGSREVKCPFHIYLEGSGQDEIRLVADAYSVDVFYAKFYTCMIAFTDDTAFFRYIPGEPHDDKYYLYIRLGIDYAAAGTGYRKTIQSEPIDLTLLNVRGYSTTREGLRNLVYPKDF